MNASAFPRFRRPRYLAAAAFALALTWGLCPAVAPAAELLLFPEDGPAVPAYARFTAVSDLGFTDGEWFAIPFYRDPGCVPLEFNLLELFDRPRAWDCEAYIEGFEIRSQPRPAPPEHFYARGLEGMQIWFVNFGELQDVVEDNGGVVTIVDLILMDSLQIGVAESYLEELQTAFNPVSSHRIVTFGELLDGTPFLASFSHGSSTDVPKIQAYIEIGF
jgi:hypothetical protein